jgi:hypothetical protein
MDVVFYVVTPFLVAHPIRRPEDGYSLTTTTTNGIGIDTAVPVNDGPRADRFG